MTDNNEISFFLQILGLFYMMLAIILVGTNCGRKKGMEEEDEDMKKTVQVMEGKEVKCKVIGNKENIVFLEEEV